MNILCNPPVSTPGGICTELSLKYSSRCCRGKTGGNINGNGIAAVIAEELSHGMISGTVPAVFIQNTHLRIPLGYLVGIIMMPHSAPELRYFYCKSTGKQNRSSSSKRTLKSNTAQSAVHRNLHGFSVQCPVRQLNETSFRLVRTTKCKSALIVKILPECCGVISICIGIKMQPESVYWKIHSAGEMNLSRSRHSAGIRRKNNLNRIIRTALGFRVSGSKNQKRKQKNLS